MLLDDFIRLARDNVNALRERLRQKTAAHMATPPDLSSHFTGDAYVESAGTVLHFENGAAEFVYTPTATDMIDRSYGRSIADREAFFDMIAMQLPRPSRVLNIGAGADTVPVITFQRRAHEVICTDMAEDTVHVLREKIDVPAFACDMVHLDVVLPEATDFAIGNSVLAYVDPAKLRRVVRNVAEAFKRAAVFTFDLAPHPQYFRMINEREQQTLVNASDPDPVTLLQYIAQYGPRDGINAMAFYSHYRGLAVNLAMVELLRALFEQLGMRCVAGASTGALTTLTLRVSRDYDAILTPTSNEVSYQDPDTYFREQAAAKNNLHFVMYSVDRISGELLARALGMHRDVQTDPWHIAEHIARTQDSSSLLSSIREGVLSGMTPSAYLAKIRPYLDGRSIRTPRPLPRAVSLDQVLHKMVITGAASFGREQADHQIDAAYAMSDRGAIEQYRSTLRALGIRRPTKEQSRTARNRAKAERRKRGR